MSKPVQYIKCPRCELNYILKKDKYCDVCKAEMKAGCLEESDIDELDEGLELCPICKVNYIQEGETMCASCQEEQLEGNSAKDDEPDWRGFVDKTDEEDDEELDLLPIEEDEEIDEELEGAFAKDLENEFEEEDDEEDTVSEEDDVDEDFDVVDDEEIDDDEDDEDDFDDEEDVDDEDF